MKKIFILFLAFMALSACSGSDYKASVLDAGTKGKQDTIKIGIVGAFSGDAGVFGEDLHKILDFETDKLNKKYAEQGKSFELVYEDGKCTGPDSVAAFQKLTDVDGIDLIIGGLCSSETLAIAPLAQEKNVLLLSALSSNPDIEKEGDYVFSLSYKDDLVGSGIARELNQYKRIALISEQNDYNIGIRKEILAKIDKGIQIVSDERFAKGGNDFRSLLEKVAKSKPDAIFLNPNPGTTAENLIKQLSEIPALNGVKLISQVAYLADSSRVSVPKTAENMVIIDAPQVTEEKFLKNFNEISAEKGGIKTIGYYYTASTLDAIDILTDLTVKYGDSPEMIKNALRSGSFEGNLGNISFGQDIFVRNIPVGRYIVENGKAIYQK